jgi:hypothetical protein
MAFGPGDSGVPPSRLTNQETFITPPLADTLTVTPLAFVGALIATGAAVVDT